MEEGITGILRDNTKILGVRYENSLEVPCCGIDITDFEKVARQILQELSKGMMGDEELRQLQADTVEDCKNMGRMPNFFELQRSAAKEQRIRDQAEFSEQVEEIFEEIEKKFGYFSDDGLEKIIIDDGGYYGEAGSLKKYQHIKSKYIKGGK